MNQEQQLRWKAEQTVLRSGRNTDRLGKVLAFCGVPITVAGAIVGGVLARPGVGIAIAASGGLASVLVAPGRSQASDTTEPEHPDSEQE